MSVPDEIVPVADAGSGPVSPAELAERFGLSYLAEISSEMLDSSLVAKLPVEWARSHCLLPVRMDDTVCVLTADPGRITDREDLALLLGDDLQPVVASRDTILKCIEECYYSKSDSAEDFIRDLDGADAGAAGAGRRGSDDLLQMAGDAPVTHLINLILLEAFKSRASDIHFEPFESRLRVRFRIDGQLYEQAAPPKHMEVSLVSRLKVMAHMDIAEKRLPQDGMAKVRVGEREIDIRVSTVPVAEGERVVLRLLHRESALLPLSELGMSARALKGFEQLLKQTFGLALVTGPTGSGKTTSLYAALSHLDAESLNIMTIEEPIEYELPGIGQIQVKPKIGLTFSSGLRHILRQDPDVILVGETRDIETAETAARASLTGHLVFTTLHTNDAPGAIVRMTDMGIEPYLLAASLRAVLAQRLVRRLCEHCREEVEPGDEELSRLGSLASLVAGKKIWQGTGCDRCLGGYMGRVGIYEFMTVGEDLRDEVRRGACSVSSLAESARASGMETLMQDGLTKVLDGVTSLTEILHCLGHSRGA